MNWESQVSRLLPHLLSPQGLPDAGSNIIVIDFAARLPPRLSRDDFVAFLDSLPPHPSSLLFLAKDGKVEEARRILEDNHSSLEVNWQEEEEGSSALHYACRCGHDSFVTILLAHPGIDVNLKDKRGGTPLFGAFYLAFVRCWGIQGSRSMSQTLMDALRCGILFAMDTLTASGGGLRLEGR